MFTCEMAWWFWWYLTCFPFSNVWEWWGGRTDCRVGMAEQWDVHWPLCPPPLPPWLRKPIGASGLLALWNQGLSPSQMELFDLEVAFSKKMKRNIRAVLSCILFLCKKETAPGMPTATHMWSSSVCVHGCSSHSCVWAGFGTACWAQLRLQSSLTWNRPRSGTFTPCRPSQPHTVLLTTTPSIKASFIFCSLLIFWPVLPYPLTFMASVVNNHIVVIPFLFSAALVACLIFSLDK